MTFFVGFSLFFPSKIYQPLEQRALQLQLGSNYNPLEFYTALLHAHLLAASRSRRAHPTPPNTDEGTILSRHVWRKLSFPNTSQLEILQEQRGGC